MQGIIYPPSREEFEAKVKRFCTKRWVERILWAWDICGNVHHYQRDDGSFYYNHPRAAAWILIQEVGIRDPRLIILALLHDTGEVEEGAFTYEDVDGLFGDDFLTQGHKAITKLRGQHPREYTAQVFAGGIRVVIVKFADRLHNHRTLAACDPKKQDRIIIDTWMYYYPDTGDYAKFLEKATKKEKEAIRLLWKLIVKAIDELLATR